MILYIKNMVCPRCKMAVETILKEVGVNYLQVQLGEVTINKELTEEQLAKLKVRLEEIGFELLDDQRQKLIEKVKNYLIEQVQAGNLDEHFSLKERITKQVNKDYSAISKLFTQLESITLEQFFILQKIEKVKEWLAYDEYYLSEISDRLGYSSVAHLSNQFKKVTGLTPSAFKVNHEGLRKTVDDVG